MHDPDPGHPALEGEEVVQEGAGVVAFQNVGDVARERLLVRWIGVDPRGVSLRLRGRLDHESLHPLDKSRRRRIVGAAERPGAQQSLVEQVFFPSVGAFQVVDRGSLASVPPRPARQADLPFVGEFRNDVDPEPRVLAALGVVGRGGRKPSRPLGEPVGVQGVKRGRACGEP